MGHVFSVELPVDFDVTSFDVLDVEPDIDGVDWVEDDPVLPDGSANIYIYRASTTGISLHLDTDFEVWVPSLASAADWQLAFGVIDRAAELFETVFVRWNDDDVWDLAELSEHCDGDWQAAQLSADIDTVRTRLESEETVVVPGPMRRVHIGPWVMDRVAEGSASIDEVLLRTNYVDGPHLVAQAATDGDRLVTVLGPGLRTLLPPADAVLLDTIDTAHPPVLVNTDALDTIDGLVVTRLDEGHRIVNAVPEAAWPDVLRAALPHALT